MTQAFLNIASSLKGMKWRAALDDGQAARALGLSQRLGLNEHIARLLVTRNIEEQEIEHYMAPTLRFYMVNPRLMQDMQRAAERIIRAIKERQAIVIYGDYDVDGACSSALLANFLNFYGIEPVIYIPDRLLEGYGPNPAAFEKLIKEGAELIITVDCGSISAGALEVAQQYAIDVVVFDHHQISANHNLAYALVNPKRNDDLSCQEHLCAAGVVFMALVHMVTLLRAEGQDVPDLLRFLDLVALATICDIVPLCGINRVFVLHGLKVARAGGNIGLKALIEAANIYAPLNSFHMGFILGPRINAGGRIGDQALGAKLLSTKNEARAQEIALQLSNLNHERQQMEREQLAQAEDNLRLAFNEQVPSFIILAEESWHPGIVGLLAARLKERYYRPSLIFASKPDGSLTGSARSIDGFDIGKAVRKMQEEGIITKGGGHAMAAGLSLQAENLGLLRSRLTELYSEQIMALVKERSLIIDGVLSRQALTLDFYRELDKIGPYGAGNNAPIFVLPNVTLRFCRIVGEKHLQLRFGSDHGKDITIPAFNEANSVFGQYLQNALGQKLHIAGNLVMNYWRGRAQIEFHLKDAALA